MSIFAIGILGVIGMQLYAIGGNSFAWNTSLAEQIAQQKIEYLKSLNYYAIKGMYFGIGNAANGGYPSQVSLTDLPQVDRKDLIAANTNGTIDGCVNGCDHDNALFVTAPVLPGYDDGNTFYVDRENYQNGTSMCNATSGNGIRRDPNKTMYDDDGQHCNAPPFDRFRRVTIIKVIDGVNAENNGGVDDNVDDCMAIIKVLVYWKDSKGVEHRVSMMTTKALGG